MAATGVGFVLVIPILLFLAALSVAFPSAAFKILGGSLLTVAFLALFWVGAQRQGRVRARAVAPAQVAPIEADVQEEGAPAIEIIEE
ncbi:MAG: hypothetical protein ABIF82_10130 [Planctomycetota bacterium]